MTACLLCAGVAFLLRTGTPPAAANGYERSAVGEAEPPSFGYSASSSFPRGAVATPLPATPKHGEGGRGFERDGRGYNLTFSERVAYQYAIEEVYWRHRIWPKDNPGPKPSLDEVLSPKHIQRKVVQYLRHSQLLEEGQQPITREHLQAEIDRMARDTKQSNVLRELFAALGNDPFVVAECLARSILAERLIAQGKGGSSSPLLDGKSNREAIKNSWPAAPVAIARGAADPPETDPMSLPTQRDDAAYKLPQISVPDDCTNDTWATTTTVNAPERRVDHTAVWTGSEMIIWGGLNFSSGNFNTGGRYNPATDSWMATSSVNAPAARGLHAAVWTGSEMIVWGGETSTASQLNTGGRYNPITDSWTKTSTANAPNARASHTAVWTGSEMIVWGGYGCGGNCEFPTGGRYTPTSDSWTATSNENAPVARWSHEAFWTGSEMIVWGGTDGMTYQHTGGRYLPATDHWTTTSLVNVPPGRVGHAAVWTGNEMIVWGGVDETFNVTNTGGRYNPVNDSWVATNLTSTPSPRAGHTGVWTGSEMIAWAGGDTSGSFNTGGRYNPTMDSWRATTTANAPSARNGHTAVWTGSQMIVWGGIGGGNFLNTGGRYCAQPSAPIVQSAVSRKTHGNAGSFDVNLPLSGTPGIECRTGGATGDYTIVLTFLADVSVAGSPQAAVTSGIGTIGTGGVSNGGMVTVAGTVVTVPLTDVANAQTINVTLNNVNGSTNIVIPMSILIGDTTGDGHVNASDISQTKSRLGQAVDGTNFRCDANANGAINSGDVSLVKSALGTGLP